jgi:hypothetical protein
VGRNFGKWIGIAVMTAMFCVAGLVLSGEAQADRFINNGNGTVADTQTGLMWADKDNGSNINWYSAKSYCEGYSGGGKSGWRMPTMDELRQLYNSGAYGSVIQRSKTGRVCIWSSETSRSDAYCFDFLDGLWLRYPQSYDPSFRALPVRSGQ